MKLGACRKINKFATLLDNPINVLLPISVFTLFTTTFLIDLERLDPPK